MAVNRILATNSAFVYLLINNLDWIFFGSKYLNLHNLTAGNHALEKIDGMFSPLSVCQELYRHADISPSNETFDIDPHVDTGTTYFVIILFI